MCHAASQVPWASPGSASTTIEIPIHSFSTTFLSSFLPPPPPIFGMKYINHPELAETVKIPHFSTRYEPCRTPSELSHLPQAGHFQLKCCMWNGGWTWAWASRCGNMPCQQNSKIHDPENLGFHGLNKGFRRCGLERELNGHLVTMEERTQG